MTKIQKHPTFYVELSSECIKVVTRLTVSIYPIWLGKNRAIMRDAVAYFNRHAPETLGECMEIVSRFSLSGQGSNESPNSENFGESTKTIDKHKIFW